MFFKSVITILNKDTYTVKYAFITAIIIVAIKNIVVELIKKFIKL